MNAIKRHTAWGLPTILTLILGGHQLYATVSGMLEERRQEKARIEDDILRFDMELCRIKSKIFIDEGWTWDISQMRCEKD